MAKEAIQYQNHEKGLSERTDIKTFKAVLIVCFLLYSTSSCTARRFPGPLSSMSPQEQGTAFDAFVLRALALYLGILPARRCHDYNERCSEQYLCIVMCPRRLLCDNEGLGKCI